MKIRGVTNTFDRNTISTIGNSFLLLPDPDPDPFISGEMKTDNLFCKEERFGWITTIGVGDHAKI